MSANLYISINNDFCFNFVKSIRKTVAQSGNSVQMRRQKDKAIRTNTRIIHWFPLFTCDGLEIFSWSAHKCAERQAHVIIFDGAQKPLLTICLCKHGDRWIRGIITFWGNSCHTSSMCLVGMKVAHSLGVCEIPGSNPRRVN